MLPVVVVDFDSSASAEQRTAILSACNQALATTECVAGEADDPRPTLAIALVTWLEPGRVRLEVGTNAPERWFAHELEFGRQEPEREQWQTVGFTIGTLVGEESTARDDRAVSQTQTRTEVAPSVHHRAVRLAPRVGVGMDRPTTLVGGVLDLSVSPSTTWTPLASVGYALPARPATAVRWRELDLGLGVAAGHAFLDLEVRAGVSATVTRITASDGVDTQGAWVPGVRIFGELRWPRDGSVAWATRLDGQANDGATRIRQGGRHEGSSPAWLLLLSSGLELRF